MPRHIPVIGFHRDYWGCPDGRWRSSITSGHSGVATKHGEGPETDTRRSICGQLPNNESNGSWWSDVRKNPSTVTFVMKGKSVSYR